MFRTSVVWLVSALTGHYSTPGLPSTWNVLAMGVCLVGTYYDTYFVRTHRSTCKIGGCSVTPAGTSSAPNRDLTLDRIVLRLTHQHEHSTSCEDGSYLGVLAIPIRV